MRTWVVSKILAFLTTQEGFTQEIDAEDGVILQDAFGFRYKIEVKTLGRITDCTPTKWEYAKESRFLDINEGKSGS